MCIKCAEILLASYLHCTIEPASEEHLYTPPFDSDVDVQLGDGHAGGNCSRQHVTYMYYDNLHLLGTFDLVYGSMVGPFLLHN